ncbi:hypothetical protein [Oscillatoria sp. FACHB-1406]|uniref:hypothetical protein n=1 Tax=Oscillatoria sp. FACHB-1406 TaxID=2692846 RepID=UPI0016853270|nr:hypothetical protein [Oscillatoria sp. FACHB-1406]MBD2577772.1 hypothetical protein [Oscillatoria sp. FACHB-1406]
MKFEREYKECLDKLVWATQQLQVEVETTRLDEVAKLIVQPMTGPWRYFHTPQHIFEVGGSQDAIEVLASLFHDLVYVQVDWSINFGISYYIAPYIKEENNRLQIRAAEDLPFDILFDMTASIFGFAPETILNPFAGQNEFLSALVAVKALETILTPEHLFKITACIEATIPFRGPTEEGKSVSDCLYERLEQTNRRFQLQIPASELEETVKRAVRVANRDTISFTYPTPDFLSNTWNLLPETNHNLVDSSSSYRVREYRLAVQKMEGFMRSLKPELIFRQYKGEPEEEIYQITIEKASRNLEIAKLYLGTKLFAIAVIEALSLRIGIDIPLSTLMGELPYQNSLASHWENFIPDIPYAFPPQTEIEEEVMKLLEVGRTEDLSYDLKNSPLATFMVKAMGFDRILHQLPLAKDFFAGQLDSEAFIKACDPTVLEVVVNGIVKLLESRKQAICSSVES